jgi:hypothetical protein
VQSENRTVGRGGNHGDEQNCNEIKLNRGDEQTKGEEGGSECTQASKKETEHLHLSEKSSGPHRVFSSFFFFLSVFRFPCGEELSGSVPRSPPSGDAQSIQGKP